MNPIPLLLSEIVDAERIDDETAKIKDYEVKALYTYGFIKRVILGEPSQTDEDRWEKAPAIILMDESGENEVFARPKSWDLRSIQSINTKETNDMVIIKANVNFYENKKTNSYGMNLNIDYIIDVTIESVNSVREIFLWKLLRARLGEWFKSGSYIHQFLLHNGIPIEEKDGMVRINAVTDKKKEPILLYSEKDGGFELDKEIDEEDITKELEELEDEIIGEEPAPVKKGEQKTTKKKTSPKKTETKKRQKITESKSKNVTKEDVFEFIKKKKKATLNEIMKTFGISEEEAWRLALRARNMDKAHIKVKDENDETTLIYT